MNTNNTKNTNTVNSTAVTVKKTQGRRKIAIKPIANQNSRHVTFSKRRLGLFKKASELCILSGAEIAIIVQSLKRQRLFAFGHPNADAIIDRYLSGKSTSSSPLAVDHQSNFVQQNNEYYSQICRELEAEKRKKEVIDESKIVNGNNNGGFWWNERTNDMGIEELEEFQTALEELKKKVNMRADELSMLNGSSLPSTSTMNHAVDYCASIVPYDFNHQVDGQF
ncbi:agamous-like MADS-box protein AGL62 [Lycium barbarum]|uniref:agamous-like MADS-box protein AGL62 n=1 Tax=Lycium barbarum TaxID=112863 RepID=UPI00293E7B55|nr:agamous-like MADS-box protein AGL62 [Lycium barbarum]